MSNDLAILNRSGDVSLQLDFEIPTADYGDFWLKARHPRFMKLLGAGMITVAAFSAGLHYGVNKTGSVWFMELTFLVQIIMGWGFVTDNSVMRWINRKTSKGMTRTHLELDVGGVRGTIETDIPWQKRPDIKRINYVWRQVRKFHHPTDCIVLEFHGGGTVMIPDLQFDTLDDMQQCLDWAEQGLIEQRKMKRAMKPAAA